MGEEASEDVTAVTELMWLCVCVWWEGMEWCQGSEHTFNHVRSLLLSVMGPAAEKCCRILRLVFL